MSSTTTNTCCNAPTESITLLSDSTDCTAETCAELAQVKSSFQIFVNPHSGQKPQEYQQDMNDNNDLSCSNIIHDTDNNMMVPSPQQSSSTMSSSSSTTTNSTPLLSQPSLAINFTQGTTELQQDLIISVPTNDYLEEHMEYLQNLLHVEPTLSLQELVICVSYLLQNGKDAADLELVENVLQRYDATTGDFKPFMYVDNELQYTRNLIATDNKNWTLLLLCWNPRSQSPVHDHPQCQCFVRMLDGALVEYRYHHPDTNNSNDDSTSQLQCFSQAECRTGMVTYMNDSLGLHKLQNKTDSVAYTLHLYFPPYSSCKIFLNQSKVATISNICYHAIRGKQNFFNGLFTQTNSEFNSDLADICKKE